MSKGKKHVLVSLRYIIWGDGILVLKEKFFLLAYSASSLGGAADTAIAVEHKVDVSKDLKEGIRHELR